MSYCVMISTYLKIDKYNNEFVSVKDFSCLCNCSNPLKNDKHAYFLVRKSMFTNLYFPNKKIRGEQNKDTLIEVVKELNSKFLIKKIFFVDLGEDETIHRNVVCNINEFIFKISDDSIDSNVLYNINHEYYEFNS